MGRTTSGILATIGGSLAILHSFVEAPPGSVPWMWYFFLGFAGLTGGILLLCDVMAGGIIALVGGAIGIFFSLFFTSSMTTAYFLAIFHTMALTSGITGITSSSEL